jgi:hypothetical protein
MMSDMLSFAEMEEQHVELLPPRTVLSLLNMGPPSRVCNPSNINSGGGTQTCASGWGGFNWGNVNYGGTQSNSAGVGYPR